MGGVWRGESVEGRRPFLPQLIRYNLPPTLQFAKNITCLAHAASLLTPMLPASSSAGTALATGADYKLLSAGEQRERTRAIEEGLRRSLGGLEGGWSVKVDDGWVWRGYGAMRRVRRADREVRSHSGLATRSSRTSTPGLPHRQ